MTVFRFRIKMIQTRQIIDILDCKRERSLMGEKKERIKK